MFQPLIEKLRAARQRTDALFAWLTPAALYERPIAERHRIVFYVGHLEAFDWNLLCRDCLGRKSRDAALEQLFAFGIDPIEHSLPSDGPGDWPAIEQVRLFVQRARADVDADLASGPLAGWLAEGWAVRLAIEHRLMHAETLAYLFKRLPLPLLQAGPTQHQPGAMPVEPLVLRIPPGVATLGLSRQHAPHTGWDNEYDEHQVEVDGFRIDRYPTSNAAFLQFVDDGGYEREALWAPADWAWVIQQHVRHPASWRKADGSWWLRTMFSERPLPASWPAQVSHAEASAFARWNGGRLMTEAEWHRAALGTPAGSERTFPWGSHAPVPGTHGTFGFSSVDVTPLGSTPAGQSAFGVDELLGNGWEWTSTVFSPFAGFEPLPFYRGYSTNFFDGKHFVMKGASAFTDTTFLRRSFRNWFQPRYPHVFSKFRTVFS